MKRSDMIKALEETFSKFESPSSIAERALSTMEANGMLPPENGTNYVSYWEGDEYFGTTSPSHEWDRE